MIMRLNEEGFLLGETGGEEVNLAYGELLQAQVDELTPILVRLRAQVDEVHKDTGLNAVGKQARIAQRANAARTEVRQLGIRRRQKIDQDLRMALEGIPDSLPYLKNEDSVLRFLREREIRDALMTLSEPLRHAAVLEAAETGDIELLLAVERAPTILKIVSADTKKKARERWLELNRADEFRRVSTVQSALSLYEHNLQQAESTIAKTSGTPLQSDVPGQLELDRLAGRKPALAGV